MFYVGVAKKGRDAIEEQANLLLLLLLNADSTGQLVMNTEVRVTCAELPKVGAVQVEFSKLVRPIAET